MLVVKTKAIQELFWKSNQPNWLHFNSKLTNSKIVIKLLIVSGLHLLPNVKILAMHVKKSKNKCRNKERLTIDC